MEPFASRPHDKMKEVLMNPNDSGPAIHYYMIRGGSDKRNVTVWETGTVGGEYIKTYGHYHIIDFKEIYTIAEGEGVLLLQIRKKDVEGNWIDEEIESFQAIRVKTGDIIPIPSFAGHALVNIGRTWLVTTDDSPVNLQGDSVSMPEHADYKVMAKMHGMAYYVIEKDGQPVLVANPSYKSVPPATIVQA